HHSRPRGRHRDDWTSLRRGLSLRRPDRLARNLAIGLLPAVARRRAPASTWLRQPHALRASLAPAVRPSSARLRSRSPVHSRAFECWSTPPPIAHANAVAPLHTRAWPLLRPF